MIGSYSESVPTIYVQGLMEESATQKQRLGTIRELDDGRKFRYAGFTAAAVAAGVCVSKAAAPVASTTAAADALLAVVDASEVSVTVAGVTAGQFKDGFAIVTTGTGIGEVYKIRNNGATDGIATGRIRLQLYDKIKTAWLAADTVVHLWANAYSALLINPAVADENATTQECVMGVTIRPMTASYFGWIQTHGLGGMLLDVAAAAGAESNEMQIVQGPTAGRGGVIIPLETTFFWGTQILGHTIQSADLTNAYAHLVFIDIE